MVQNEYIYALVEGIEQTANKKLSVDAWSVHVGDITYVLVCADETSSSSNGK